MLNSSRISLNAVRVFTAAARHRSIALAAAELGVTPGAVSHQIRKLESDLGIKLFARTANAIALTDDGRRFHEDAAAAITMIERSADSLRRDANDIVIRVSMSIAVRWLIPALEGFKRRHPDARVRVESVYRDRAALGASADMAISYHRADRPDPPGELLVADLSRPVASPALLAACGYRVPGDIARVPALKCSEENWDWKKWAAVFDIDAGCIAMAYEFDTDDAALRAAVGGLGMALSPALMTQAEIRSGTLVDLAGFPPVELGSYRLSVRDEPNRMVRHFRDWLRGEARRVDAG